MIGVPIVPTDGRHLYYNTQFSKMTTKEIESVIAHEISHCVFDHMKRREDRELQLHNIACDYIVNNTLMDQNIGEKPKTYRYPKTTNTVVGLPKRYMMTYTKKVKRQWRS